MTRVLVVLFLFAFLVADAYRMWGRDGAVLVAVLLVLLLALPRLLGAVPAERPGRIKTGGRWEERP